MKNRVLSLSLVISIFFITGAVNAATLFYSDFESDLSAWTGRSDGTHDGVITVDPLAAVAGNNVLSFSQMNSGGDIFTSETFTSFTAGEYILSFDYLGLNNGSGTVDNLGGFIGFSYGYPGTHTWIGGTGSGYPDLLPDSGEWEQVQISFSAGDNIHLMLEDFSGSQGVAGDVFFDNILLTDANGPSGFNGSDEVPEPTTMILFGLGLLGFSVRSKRKN